MNAVVMNTKPPLIPYIIARYWTNAEKRQTVKLHSLVSIPESTEFLLASSIPTVEPDFATVSKEIQRMNLHSNCCCQHEKKDRLHGQIYINKDRCTKTTCLGVNHRKEILRKHNDTSKGSILKVRENSGWKNSSIMSNLRSYLFSNSPVRCLLTNVVFPEQLDQPKYDYWHKNCNQFKQIKTF
jgi:hypothetical protein